MDKDSAHAAGDCRFRRALNVARGGWQHSAIDLALPCAFSLTLPTQSFFILQVRVLPRLEFKVLWHLLNIGLLAIHEVVDNIPMSWQKPSNKVVEEKTWPCGSTCSGPLFLFCAGWGTRSAAMDAHASLAGKSAAKKRTVLGIEPRTTCTRSENHTTRPSSQLIHSGNVMD